MSKRSFVTLTAGVLVGALLLMGAGFPTKTTPAKQWAVGVCTAVGDWVNATKAGASELDASLQSTNPQLSDVRGLLVSYLGDTADATTNAIDGMNEAGVPATPKGKAAAAGLTGAFKKIRASLRKLQNQAEDMDIQRKARALVQLKRLNTKVGVEFGSFTKALNKLSKLDPEHKLRAAFKATPECQAL